MTEWTELLRLLVRETKGGEVCQRMQHRIPVVSLHQNGLLLVLPSDLSQVTLQVAAVFSVASYVPATDLDRAGKRLPEALNVATLTSVAPNP